MGVHSSQLRVMKKDIERFLKGILASLKMAAFIPQAASRQGDGPRECTEVLPQPAFWGSSKQDLLFQAGPPARVLAFPPPPPSPPPSSSPSSSSSSSSTFNYEMSIAGLLISCL